MSVKILCSVLDMKGLFYSAPFASINENTAARDFAAAVSDKDSQIGKFPEDFRLMKVGEFDDNTGRITNIDPVFLVDGIAFVEEK